MKEGQVPLLPAIFTTANLACGILACVLAVNDALRLEGYKDVLTPFAASAWLIVAAVVFDALDGLAARKTKSETRFGVEYDSLADVVSFGMAPALLLYVAVLRFQEFDRFGWLLVLMYVVCGAIRLARYNTLAAGLGGSGKYFLGLPIPAAAGLLTSYVLFSMWGNWHVVDQGAVFNKVMGWYQQRVTYVNRVVLPLGMALVSLLMVSSIEYPKISYWLTKGRVSIPMFVSVALALVLVGLTPPVGSFLVFATYAAWGLVATAVHRGMRRVGTPESWRNRGETKSLGSPHAS